MISSKWHSTGAALLRWPLTRVRSRGGTEEKLLTREAGKNGARWGETGTGQNNSSVTSPKAPVHGFCGKGKVSVMKRLEVSRGVGGKTPIAYRDHAHVRKMGSG